MILTLTILYLYKKMTFKCLKIQKNIPEIISLYLIIFVACSLPAIESKTENVEDYLLKQSKSIANGEPRGLLPRGTILMVGSAEVNSWFNLDGHGIGEYAGTNIQFLNLF